MEPHPIEELMKTVMENIKEMVYVNTIVGDAVQTADGTVIIPVSRVTFGFAAGGGEYAKGDNRGADSGYPFAGGSGAGISINPVAFMVVGRNNTFRMVSASYNNPIDRLLETIPNIIEQIKKMISGKDQEKEAEKKDSRKEDEKKTEDKEDKLPV